MPKDMRFKDYANDIEKYCLANSLDFNKLKGLVYGLSSNFMVFQYYDGNPNNERSGLLDETPMPVALWVRKNKSSTLEFEQTEHTRRYLALDA